MTEGEQKFGEYSQAPWKNWQPDLPLVRWVVLGITAVGVISGTFGWIHPVLGNAGHWRISPTSPYKAILLGIASLQIWCLFTPRTHRAVRTMFRCSLWQIAFVV